MHPLEPGTLRVEFLNDCAGEAALIRRVLHADPLLGRVRRREALAICVRALVLFLPIAWVAMAIVFRTLIGSRQSAMEREFSTFLTWLTALVWTVLYGLWAVPRGRLATFRAALEQHLAELRRAPSAPTTIEVGARGVRVASGDAASEFGWSYFERVEVIEGFLAFAWHRALGGIAVPLGAFASPGAGEEFRAKAHEWLVASGHDAGSRVRALIGDRSVLCPRCAYQLRGITEARCPECGRDVTTFDIDRVDDLRRPFWKVVLGIGAGPRPEVRGR